MALLGGTLALVRPMWLRPVFVAAMIVTFPIGWVVSHVLLTIMFYVVFTPLGLVFRFLGRDPLLLRRSVAPRTYWLPKATAVDVHSYFNQY